MFIEKIPVKKKQLKKDNFELVFDLVKYTTASTLSISNQ